MPLACNINSHGRTFRLICGLVLTAAAVFILLFWAPGHSLWRWIISGCLLVAGLAGLFEAYHSWCVMRALGFKTRW